MLYNIIQLIYILTLYIIHEIGVEGTLDPYMVSENVINK